MKTSAADRSAAAIASSAGGEAHSAESVRHKIKQLIDAEKSGAEVHSDDRIVEILKDAGVDNARVKKALEDSLKAAKEAEEEGGVYVNPVTGEVGGPRGPEPTRFGDWNLKGRVSDF